MACLDHSPVWRLARGFTEGSVFLGSNIIAGIFCEDIFLFIDNSDIKNMRSSIKFGDCNDTVFLDLADFSTMH